MSRVAPVVLKVPEVMAVLGMSRGKVYDLIRARKLKSFTEGRSRRIPLTAVHEYVQSKMEEAA
ncbi:excisionase [Kitasatospora griseola]|uniref:Excisionase n=1 Tax=Kitasatospora griseola TaxID=2064 RepID=A0A0D0NU84_KITGR|nr:helix-turn-helix domain-containing protein [Kitasatospora griseola]KIQ62696.1 excisionase [Kitasatospora griseola]